MTTPGAVRTKVWKLANKERSKEYMKEYMRKRRAKLSAGAEVAEKALEGSIPSPDGWTQDENSYTDQPIVAMTVKKDER